MTRTETEQKMIAYLDALAKPKGSLGHLEEYALKMALIQGQVPPQVGKKAVFVFAGDHGIVEEGVSLYPSEVTYQMMLNFLSGGAGINALAGGTGWEIFAVDAGVIGELPPDSELPTKATLIRRKVREGSANFLKQDAMTEAELEAALRGGAELAHEAKKQGFSLVAIGDMGIGNTTTAAALLVASGFPADSIIDRGTGIDDAMLERKRTVILEAIVARGPFSGARDILRKLGSPDLAMMAGFILGLKGLGIGCVIDGFPVTSAAFMARGIDPEVTDWLFAGHRSRVKGHLPVLEAMGLAPIVSLEMRLGEGTGAVIGGFLVELAVKAASEMASFSSAGVSESAIDEKDY